MNPFDPLSGWRFIGRDDVPGVAHDAPAAKVIENLHHGADPAAPIPPAPAGPPAPAPPPAKRRFYLKFSDGRTLKLELLWIPYRAWRKRPEAAPGSSWGVWRLGDYVVAYRLDG